MKKSNNQIQNNNHPNKQIKRASSNKKSDKPNNNSNNNTTNNFDVLYEPESSLSSFPIIYQYMKKDDEIELKDDYDMNFNKSKESHINKPSIFFFNEVNRQIKEIKKSFEFFIDNIHKKTLHYISRDIFYH